MASTPLLRFSPQTLKTPFLPQNPRIVTPPRVKISQSKPTTKISMSSYQTVPAPDRLVSSLSYFLPFFNGLQYGRFLFTRYPTLVHLLQPVLPILNVYRSLPYASFVAFFALYLGVVRNPSFSRYVRFNSMQAVVLDVLLSLPLLVQRIFSPGRGVGLKVLEMGYNGIFVFIGMCFVYSLVSCVLGRTPYLPFVADAAEKQLGF